MVDSYTEHTSQDPRRAPTALIVEDDPGCAYLWTRYLGNGWRTIITGRGDEAVGLAKISNPDLILLDIELPGLSGWDVLTILRADPKTRSVPVLICSGVYDPARSRALGANGHLHKPVRLETFRRAVAEARVA